MFSVGYASGSIIVTCIYVNWIVFYFHRSRGGIWQTSAKEETEEIIDMVGKETANITMFGRFIP